MHRLTATFCPACGRKYAFGDCRGEGLWPRCPDCGGRVCLPAAPFLFGGPALGLLAALAPEAGLLLPGLVVGAVLLLVGALRAV